MFSAVVRDFACFLILFCVERVCCVRACVRGGPTFSDLIWALNEFVACVRCVRLLRAIVACVESTPREARGLGCEAPG